MIGSIDRTPTPPPGRRALGQILLRLCRVRSDLAELQPSFGLAPFLDERIALMSGVPGLWKYGIAHYAATTRSFWHAAAAADSDQMTQHHSGYAAVSSAGH